MDPITTRSGTSPNRRARRRLRARAWVGALALLVTLACGDADPPLPPPATHEPPSPRGVIALSPSASRFVVAIGAGGRLVAVDAASRALPELAHLPAVTLADLPGFGPALALLPQVPAAGDPDREALRAAGVEPVEFAPHDLEDVFALCRGIGARLVGVAAANRFERRIARPLALVGGAAPEQGRPRVVALVELDPPTWAGGHSFETDLIEIAGGTSVTHGSDETRVEPTPEQWRAAAPDLVVVMTPRPLSPEGRDAARAAIPAELPIAFFDFDRDLFWLAEPARDAERLRTLLTSADRGRSP